MWGWGVCVGGAGDAALGTYSQMEAGVDLSRAAPSLFGPPWPRGLSIASFLPGRAVGRPKIRPTAPIPARFSDFGGASPSTRPPHQLRGLQGGAAIYPHQNGEPPSQSIFERRRVARDGEADRRAAAISTCGANPEFLARSGGAPSGAQKKTGAITRWGAGKVFF